MNKCALTICYVMVILFLISTVSYAQQSASQKTEFNSRLQIADKIIPVRIVCSPASEEFEMAQYITKFLRERNFAVQSKVADELSDSYIGPQWVLATTNSYKSLKVNVVLPGFPKSGRDEAFVMDSHQSKNGPEVVLVGKSISGLRAAVARFISKVANDGNAIWIEAGREERDPFIKLRILTASNAARRQAPKESPFREADCQTWSLDRLRAYPEMFWQFGYNGMQVDEDRGYGSVSGEDLARIQNALKAMINGARDYHMFVSLSQWGDCLFNEGEAYCWNDPKQHDVMLSFMGDLASNYASIVDNITIRVGDPGGCTRNGCDFYKTPQQLTTAYLQVFRKINPDISGTLSIWANAGVWKYCPKKVDLSNYAPMFPGQANQKEYALPLQDGASFLDETYMPKDVSISINRFYNTDQVEAILNTGRIVDIKGWYIADMEMINNICISMQAVDKILGKMPDKARDQVRSQSIELCFDGWPEIIGQYIAAQKLWNPRFDLETLKKEYCVAAFGPKNADAMLSLYEVCENGDADTYILPIPKPSDFGTADYNAKLRKVLTEAGSVKIASDWKPNYAFPVPVQKYVDMLNARARLILAVSEAKEKVEALRKSGGDANAIEEVKKEAIESLPVLPIDPLYKQDASIVHPGFKAPSFTEMIEHL
ncbi:MAG: hypothetical protein JXB18_09940 [Sedimentisphaerales bacterium]|nr:hypothetical protein [Sedimentisphaerales bacterium]